MPKRKNAVKRAVKRLTQQAMTSKEAIDVLDEVRDEVDAKAETEGLHEGEVGTIRHGNKVTPTYTSLCKQFPIVSFTPEETVPLNYQGVRFQALAGVECHVPKCFKDIYDNHRRLSARSRVNKELANMGINIDEGVGGLV